MHFKFKNQIDLEKIQNIKFTGKNTVHGIA